MEPDTTEEEQAPSIIPQRPEHNHVGNRQPNDVCLIVSVLVRGAITHAIFETWKENLPKKIKDTEIDLSEEYRPTSDYFVADEYTSMQAFLNWAHLTEIPENMRIVNPRWVIDSLKQGAMANPLEYQHRFVSFTGGGMDDDEDGTQPPKTFKFTDSPAEGSPRSVMYPEEQEQPVRVPSGPELEETEAETDAAPVSRDSITQTSNTLFEPPPVTPRRSTRKRKAPTPPTKPEAFENQNKHITDKLEGLKNVYEASGDRWRSLVYKKAAAILKRQPRITDVSQLDGIYGIGSSIKEKVKEILETGELIKLDSFHADHKTQALQQFSNIFGVGSETAETLYKRGFKSIEELRERDQDVLTAQQRIGLKYCEELQVKIPREEVQQIEAVVDQHVQR